MIALWFFALVAWVVATAIAAGRAVTAPTDSVKRGVVVAALFALLALSGATPWLWGGATARDGRAARLAEGPTVVLTLVTAPHQRLAVRAGEVVRIGPSETPTPGLRTWNLDHRVTPPQPGTLDAARGAVAIIAVPHDPTDCSGYAHAGAVAEPLANYRLASCLVHDGPLQVIATAFVPDSDQLIATEVIATAAIMLPLVIGLIALAAAPRRMRRVAVVGRALRGATLAAALAAVVGWRLLWAARLDASDGGQRTADNLLAAAAIGAALAGTVVRWFVDERSVRHRAIAVVIGWAGWGAVAVVACGSELVGNKPLGVIGLSLIAAFAGEFTLGDREPANRATAVASELPLLALALTAAAARSFAALPLCKLGAAGGLVLLGHRALRDLLAPSTPWWRRLTLVGALAAAAFATARLDAGVTAAIGGTGLALALLVAGHDTLYDASQTGRLGVLEREHARLLLVHSIAAAAGAGAVIVAMVAASDGELIDDGARWLLNAPLIASALFAVAAVLARTHRRSWVPWLAAALAALAIWGVRERALEHAMAGDGVAARRVAAIVEPGYALLRDDRAFAANASAWREAAAPDGATGYFGARIHDPGVSHSLDNDYLPILVARELGAPGLLQGALLLLVIFVGGAVIAVVRLRHASREHRARWLIAAVVTTLVAYQPLAALGILPLTGISWPGFGIDSPADLWLFTIAAMWLWLGGRDCPIGDIRVRRTPRLVRARMIALVGLVTVASAVAVIVARAGLCALGGAHRDDLRVAAAIRYANTLACTPGQPGPAAAAIPSTIIGAPSDQGTLRFHAGLLARWRSERALLLDRLARVDGCPTAPIGGWRFTAPDDKAACVATLDVGWPRIELALSRVAAGEFAANCSIALPDDALGWLRGAAPPRPRIRVVSAPLGVASDDLGEVVVGRALVRLRPGAPRRTVGELVDRRATPPQPGTVDRRATPPQPGTVDRWATPPQPGTPDRRATPPQPGTPEGLVVASELALDDGVVIAVARDPARIVVRGPARMFVADGGRWQPLEIAGDPILDRTTLVTTHHTIAWFRPPRGWAAGARTVDSLLADAGDGRSRFYPYGSEIAELGWVNPFALEHSLGLDGWIHAANLAPPTAAPVASVAPSCGTLRPPPIDRGEICSRSPLDGVLECRVTLHPWLIRRLRTLPGSVVADPKRLTGRDTVPVRAAIVVMRGDTGELLAQATAAPGAVPSAYAPRDRAAEAELIALRDRRGESARERVEWNQPIAVGSTFKPVVARAAELAFPDVTSQLSLTAAGHAAGCRARRGAAAVDPIVGHCPPTSVAGTPATADLHDFLARSPNWFQAALGVIGLGLPSGRMEVAGQPVALDGITGSDIASWPASTPLTISDAQGEILGRHGANVAGLRRTPLWSRIEALLGRPLCTLGDRAHCERAGSRNDLCAARGLPIAAPSSDLRSLIALGPDRIDLYSDDRARLTVAVREYFQLLRGSGVHPIGSLAQIADAFNRVVFDRAADASAGSPLAASWFPAPAVGRIPPRCDASAPRTNTVGGPNGGLCGVVAEGGTAHAAIAPLANEQARIAIYGAKTGTTDSLATIARSPVACARWNDSHPVAARLECGRAPPDDSLFIISFGVITPRGTIPLTAAIQLQRGGKGAAAMLAPHVMRQIADELLGVLPATVAAATPATVAPRPKKRK